VWRVLGVVGAGLIMGGASTGAPRGPNVDLTQPDHAAATPQIVAIEQLKLSDQLADFGERHADAIALVEAAKILKQASAVLKPPAAGLAGARTWESLLVRASQIAGANPAIIGLIADVRALKVRNIPTATADASLLSKSVKKGGADRLEVRFRAGEPALVYVRPVAELDLDLFIYDEFNNLICTGASGGHEAQCRWRPRWDGPYLVDIRNNNDTEVAYVLAINREIAAR
jgi:hypothetical protein